MPYSKYKLSILPVKMGYESFYGWRQTSLIFSTVTRTAKRIVGSSWQVVLWEHLSRERRERAFKFSLALFAPKVLLRSRCGSWCSYPSEDRRAPSLILLLPRQLRSAAWSYRVSSVVAWLCRDRLHQLANWILGANFAASLWESVEFAFFQLR